MLWLRPGPRLDTDRMVLRLPRPDDFQPWAQLRRQSEAFLAPWEPQWTPGHLSKSAFSARVRWAARSAAKRTAFPFFMFDRTTMQVLGAITLDEVRFGPAQTGRLGYWIGAPYARQGLMREGIAAVVHFAFQRLDLSRIEAACLPENAASRGLLETSGFKYEGVAQQYLQIDGRWRTHVLYAMLRSDRRAAAPRAALEG